MLASIEEVEGSKAAGVYWYVSWLRILVHATDTRCNRDGYGASSGGQVCFHQCPLADRSICDIFAH